MAENENGTVMLPPAKTQEAFVHIGFAKARLTRGRAFVLAILAGAFVALGASFMLMVRSDVSLSPTISLVLGGLAFCLGLFLVLVAGAELFTGNCLMVIGALDGRYPLVRMLRKWAIVYAGNAVGALLVVVLLLVSGFAEMQGGAVGELACSVAASKASLSPVVAFSRGILCNVLVCLAVWMGSAGKTVCDKLAAAILPVVAFVVLGFEHSVANMFFSRLAWLSRRCGAVRPWWCWGLPLISCFVTLGNIVAASRSLPRTGLCTAAKIAIRRAA